MLEFEGSKNFRYRIVCATLSGKTVKIQNIRADDEKPGVRGI
jgi:RNA 3'-terminal phosphate cyclase-like protein